MLKKLFLPIRSERILLFFFLLFSTVLMTKTFGVTSEGNIRIAAKAWSDFAATLPLIRSFSFGSNFPPEYPIFAGQPIRYHFLFFAAVGFLEKLGLRLDIAFNLLSISGFFLLLSAIYFFGKIVFKSKAVGFLSTILFLFNGSFGFLEYFKKYPFFEALSKIPFNTEFSSFGPYDGKIVSAFWNLNIYTNQRHLALGYAFFLIFLLILFILNKYPKKLSNNLSLVLGLILGMTPFLHLSAFLMTGVSLILLLLLFTKIRMRILLIGFVALSLALPQFLYMGSAQVETELFKPGYLVNPLTVNNFIIYWFLNMGLTLILAPIGFLMADKEQRKVLLPFILFFIIGNLFQLSPDMPTNHKFFNLSVIGLNFFTSLFLLNAWAKFKLGKVFVSLLFIPLTLTGIIDFFPIVNDNSLVLEDIPNNKTAAFINESTPKTAVFLNASFLYDPASLAGRKIYLGWPYFSWSAGFDTTARFALMKAIVSSDTKEVLCKSLSSQKIDFVEIQEPSPIEEVQINYPLFKSLEGQIYHNPETKFSLISVKDACKQI